MKPLKNKASKAFATIALFSFYCGIYGLGTDKDLHLFIAFIVLAIISGVVSHLLGQGKTVNYKQTLDNRYKVHGRGDD